MVLTAFRESEPQFKLDIRNEPIREEDGEAQSAVLNVANTLRVVSVQLKTTPLNYTEEYIASAAGRNTAQAHREPRKERCQEYCVCTFTANARNYRPWRFADVIRVSFQSCQIGSFISGRRS